MNFVLAFLSGLFLVNGVPHFIKGVTGATHMTPFKRVSPAWLNVVWGFVNFLIAFWVFNMTSATFEDLISFDTFSLSFLLGTLFMALATAQLFSKPNARLPWHKD